MLYSINDQTTPITRIPHAKEFDAWTAKLTAEQKDTIKRELRQRIDGGEVHTSSWIPGENWENSPFQPIHDVACSKNRSAAAKCFGLFVWQVVIDHPGRWAFGRFEKNGIPIEGMTYFQI
jgi:hypothetical protein